MEGKTCAQEVLDAQAHVWNHTFNFINSMALKCAIQLGIPDSIHKHGKPMTLSELADALSINKAKSNALYRLMRILVHSKIFDAVKLSNNMDVEEEGYCLTQDSRLLLKGDTLSMSPFALVLLDQAFAGVFQHISEWFQNEDSTPFVTKHGQDVWEYAKVDERWNQMFNEGMASDARLVSSREALKVWKKVFEGVGSMVDVAAEFPGMKCTVLDLPHVIDGLQGSENLKYVSGDMFEFIPPADAVFLKWIIDGYDDEDCIKILKKCKEAVSANGGKVIIIDMVVGDHKEDDVATETQYFFDILLLCFNNGKERSEKEWAKLFLAAGFTTYKIPPLLGLRSIIEIFP